MSEGNAQSGKKTEELKTGALGLLSTTGIGIGGCVGSAIFVFASITIMLTGPLSIGVWLYAGIATIIIALCGAELAVAFPKAGGIAYYPTETLGPNRTIRKFFGFIAGWIYILNMVNGVAVSCYGAALYLSSMYPILTGQLMSLIFVIACITMNVLGVRLTGWINTILTILLTAALVIFIGWGATKINPAFYQPFVSGYQGWNGFLPSVMISWLGYTSWIPIVLAAEEIKNPQKTIPRAIGISLTLVALIYVGVMLVCAGVAPWTNYTSGLGNTAPLTFAALKFAEPNAGIATALVGWGGWLASITTAIVLMLGGSRVIFAMGRSGAFPPVVSRIHGSFKTPWIALLIMGIISVIWVLAPMVMTTLAAFGGIAMGSVLVITVISLIGLRKYRSEIKPAFRLPGGYVIPILALIILLSALVTVQQTAFLIWLGWVVIGIIYFIIRYGTKRELLQK